MHQFAIAMPSWRAAASSVSWCSAIIVAMLVAMLTVGAVLEVPMAPLWIPFAVVTMFILALTALAPWFAQRSSVELAGDSLHIHGVLYSKRLAYADIDLDGVHEIDLDAAGDERPTIRTNGLAVPGYVVGWLRSRAWQSQFALLTAPNAVVLPTNRGYSVVVSVQHPAEFIATLRQHAVRH